MIADQSSDLPQRSLLEADPGQVLLLEAREAEHRLVLLVRGEVDAPGREQQEGSHATAA